MDDRSNKTRLSMGRRYAKSPLELMAEIPHHLRRRSHSSSSLHAPCAQSLSPINTHTHVKTKQGLQLSRTRSDLSKPRLIRSTNNCTSSIGGSRHASNYCTHDMHKSKSSHRASRRALVSTTLQKPLLVRSTHSPMHRRQHAMVWDDLISVLRIEVMEDTPTTIQSCTEVSNAIELVLDNPTPPPTNTNSSLSTPYVDNSSMELSPLNSPPKAKRMSICFSSISNVNNNNGLSAFGRMVRRLSPMARRLSPPVVMRRRMSFKFGGRGSNDGASRYSRSDTYISDSEDESSLDY